MFILFMFILWTENKCLHFPPYSAVWKQLYDSKLRPPTPPPPFSGSIDNKKNELDRIFSY